MFPSKSMLDYMTDMNRLLPKTENELQTSNPYNSAYSQSPFHSVLANRSSSSADSTSPESYPDIFPPFQRSTPDLFNIRGTETPVQNYGNPMSMRKRRPIVGRKILGKTDQSQPLQVNERIEQEVTLSNSWIDDLCFTPPNNFYESKSQIRNYELFPMEKSSDLLSPTKPTMANMSPIMSNLSPTFSNFSSGISNASPHSPNFMTSYTPRYMQPQYSGFSSPRFSCASTSKIDEIGSSKMCTFCRKNGETPLVYMTHSVKEKIGTQNVVTCPILRSHVCSTCGATGDNAHTITYCPILRSSNNGKRLQSTTITLKNTRIKSNGRRRY